MDQTPEHPFRRTLISGGVLQSKTNPVLVGGVVGLIAVWVMVSVRGYADFEALQWWVYVNYDFTPRVNPFTIGPFLAGIVAGYTAGYLTDGLYENAIANAVKASLLTGVLFYLSTVIRSISAVLGSGTISGDMVLVLTLQPLLFLAIPFTLVFMAEGVVAGPVGQYIRRKLLGGDQWPEKEDEEPKRTGTIVRASIGSAAIILTITVGTWVILYSFYLFLTP